MNAYLRFYVACHETAARLEKGGFLRRQLAGFAREGPAFAIGAATMTVAGLVVLPGGDADLAGAVAFFGLVFGTVGASLGSWSLGYAATNRDALARLKAAYPDEPEAA